MTSTHGFTLHSLSPQQAYLTQKRESPEVVAFAIVDNASGDFIGYFCFISIDPEQRSLELGLWYPLTHSS